MTRSDIVLALDIYGPLFASKHRRALELRYEEDLTFGEAAERLKVSRQCVHGYVKAGLEKLDRFESTLGLLSRYKRTRSRLLSLAARIPQSRAEIEKIAASL